MLPKNNHIRNGAAVKLRIIPCSIRVASEFVTAWHRHNKAVRIARFACACADEQDIIHGVAIVGNPVARKLMDGYTAEILRCCTDGTRNACSILYSACLRACKALGYRSVITYTLHSEKGSSLLASGFVLDSENAGGADWSNRPGRIDQQISHEKKNRWRVTFKEGKRR